MTRVYVGIPNRERWRLKTLEPLIQELYAGADVYWLRYWQGCLHQLEQIRAADWYLAVIPDDGVIGRGVYEEIEIALKEKREITLLFHGVPFNCCANPFSVLNEDNWIYFARLPEVENGY